jgi:acyl CoA:acetate/3-ketoacid CoA transferase alpha subunit
VVPTVDPMVPNTPAAMAAAGMIVPVEETVPEVEVNAVTVPVAVVSGKRKR